MHKEKEIDITVDICGLKLVNPFVLSSGPPTGNGEMIRRAFEAGWAGAVTKTLTLEPQGCVNVTPFIWSVKSEDQIIGLSNIDAGSTQPIDKWVSEIKALKRDFPDRVIIASLLHTQELRQEEWRRAAEICCEAGVDALELNFACPHLLAEWGVGSAIGENPDAASKVTEWVAKAVKIPIVVKLPAFVPDIKAVCAAVKNSGAGSICSINTISALNVDIDKKLVHPNVNQKSCYSGLSGIQIKPVGLRSVAKIAECVDLPIFGIGGISTWSDAIEYIMVGASAVQICTAVMLNGYRIIDQLIEGLINYMRREQFDSLGLMTGLLLSQIVPYANLRKKPKLTSFINSQKCIKDDRCYITCRDASSGAISLRPDRTPEVDEMKCEGCALCVQVCPIPGCVELRMSPDGSKY
jgi:dihydropyrimidine dehydrogenase (NAD+) subunit PreA